MLAAVGDGQRDHTADAGLKGATSVTRAPKANAYAERWVRTVRAECLDWTLIWNRRHLEHVLRQYHEHYNTGRPHRGINLEVPTPARVSTVTPPTTGCVVERVDVLGGLIHEYRRAA